MCGETVRGKYYVHNGQPICEVDYKVRWLYIDEGSVIRFWNDNVLELLYLEENIQHNNVIFKYYEMKYHGFLFSIWQQKILSGCVWKCIF